MFTGIVGGVGTVVFFAREGTGPVLEVSTGLPLEEIRAGDSISVSGACLTVTGKGPGRFLADVSPETLNRTTFRSLAVGRGGDVGLTVSTVHPDGFEVTLIPFTLNRTTFGGARPGDRVNVETDIVGKYVLRFLERKDSGISKDFLKKHGFA